MGFGLTFCKAPATLLHGVHPVQHPRGPYCVPDLPWIGQVVDLHVMEAHEDTVHHDLPQPA